MAIVKFTEAKLEEAIIQMLRDQGYPYTRGPDLGREPNDVLIRSDKSDPSEAPKRFDLYRVWESRCHWR